MSDVHTIKETVIRAVQSLGAEITILNQATNAQVVSKATTTARAHGVTARSGLRELETHERKPNNTSRDKLMIRTTRNKLTKDLARLETLLVNATKEAQERVAASTINTLGTESGTAAWSSGNHHIERSKAGEEGQQQQQKQQQQQLFEEAQQQQQQLLFQTGNVRDQVQVDANVDMNRMLMEDREQAMVGIAKDMFQVKQMFGELAGMVEGQSDSVNQVAEQVDVAHERMAHGVEQLQAADKKQEEKKGCAIS